MRALLDEMISRKPARELDVRALCILSTPCIANNTGSADRSTSSSTWCGH